MSKKKKQVIIYFSAFFLIFVLLILYNHLCSGMISQNMAERWACGKEKYSQISVFFPEGDGKVNLNEVENISSYINKSVNEIFDNSIDNSNLWIDAYSTPAVNVDVTQYNSSDKVNMKAIGVSGSFFSFHPLELIDGNYLYDSSLNVNSAVIDEEAAWNIFFSLNVTGMSFYVGDTEFYVQGVIKKENNKENLAVYPKEPVLYLNYKAMNEISPDISILCYEAVIPLPISNYAKELLLEYYGVDDFQDQDSKNCEENLPCEIIDNTERLSYVAIISHLLNFTQNGVVTHAIAYPYWENAVRILINKLMVIMFIVVVLTVYILTVTIVFLIKKCKNRKWHLNYLTNKLIIRFTYKNKV